MKKKLILKIYTDGACSNNPGAGGWAALILIRSKKSKEAVTIKGGEKTTTNNRMELSAVLESLKFINKNLTDYDLNTEILCDSSYVVDSINSGSLNNWDSNGWKTKRDTDVANKDLWVEMLKQLSTVSVLFTKVKGHSDNKFNDYVDNVAVKECGKYKKLLEKL